MPEGSAESASHRSLHAIFQVVGYASISAGCSAFASYIPVRYSSMEVVCRQSGFGTSDSRRPTAVNERLGREEQQSAQAGRLHGKHGFSHVVLLFLCTTPIVVSKHHDATRHSYTFTLDYLLVLSCWRLPLSIYTPPTLQNLPYNGEKTAISESGVLSLLSRDFLRLPADAAAPLFDGVRPVSRSSGAADSVQVQSKCPQLAPRRLVGSRPLKGLSSDGRV